MYLLLYKHCPEHCYKKNLKIYTCKNVQFFRRWKVYWMVWWRFPVTRNWCYVTGIAICLCSKVYRTTEHMAHSGQTSKLQGMFSTYLRNTSCLSFFFRRNVAKKSQARWMHQNIFWSSFIVFQVFNRVSGGIQIQLGSCRSLDPCSPGEHATVWCASGASHGKWTQLHVGSFCNAGK